MAGPNDIVFDYEGGMWFSDFGKDLGHTVELGGIDVLTDPIRNRLCAVTAGLIVINSGLSRTVCSRNSEVRAALKFQ